MRVLVRAECFGEDYLNQKEKERYKELMFKEIHVKPSNMNPLDQLIKK